MTRESEDLPGEKYILQFPVDKGKATFNLRKNQGIPDHLTIKWSGVFFVNSPAKTDFA